MPNFTLHDKVFEEAANQFPTPFYLYDERGIRQAVRNLYKAFSWNRGFREFYAVKALPNPEILKILLDEGCGLDCSSKTELLLAQKLKVKGQDLMFSANAMPETEMALARSLGAGINLDDVSDIDILIRNGGVPDCVSLRVNPGQAWMGHNDIMGGASDAKFGIMPSQLEGALKRLKAEGASRFGLHAMTASNTLESAYYAQNASFLLNTALELEEKTGLTLAFINLSGGLGIPYRPEELVVNLPKVGQEVKQAYEALLGDRADVAVYSELGRLMTGPSGWLVARAIHKKEIWRDYIGLDACAADLMRPAMYGAYHHVSIAGKRDMPNAKTYDITGALCENNDKFAVRRPLPEIDIGDLVLIHDAGAHGHAMGYQYNGRPRCAEVLYTKEGGFRKIRRAETAEDIFATLMNF